MKIKEWLFQKKETSNKVEPTCNAQNPFVTSAMGRKEWNDRYANMAKATRNWQLAFASCVGILFIQSIIIGKMATDSKIKPFVVETNQGIPYSIKPVTGISATDNTIINYAINQFIINTKTVLSDQNAQENLLDKVSAFASDKTPGFVTDYYEKNNPFEIGKNYTVSVEIENPMPISANVWQVAWKEIKRDRVGKIIETTCWIGHITYQIGDVAEKYITDNPFGIYITDLTWSKSYQCREGGNA